jgi:hypothetical protein
MNSDYAIDAGKSHPTITATDTQYVHAEQPLGTSYTSYTAGTQWILDLIDSEISFHTEHETPLEVREYLHLRNMRTPQELVIYELNFLKKMLEVKE